MASSRLAQLGKDSVVYGLGAVLAKGIGFLLLPVLTRIFTPPEFGAIEMCWLLAFAIPFPPSILNTDRVGNTLGLVSFVAMLALVFIGYWLVDSAGSKASEGHGH